MDNVFNAKKDITSIKSKNANDYLLIVLTQTFMDNVQNVKLDII